jgi:hypothetical protein
MMPKNSPPKLLSTPEQIQKLKLFNQKIQLLKRGRFAALVDRTDHGITLNISAGVPMTTEKRGADEESTLALVTTLRFFVQERDGITLGQIADLYESLPVEEQAKTSARGAANAIDEFLERPCGIEIQGKSYSNRDVFEIFMYGGLAHANDDKRPTYEEWMKMPLAPLMQFIFEDTAATILEYVLSFHVMNERTISQLEATL